MEQADLERLVMKPTARRRLGKYVLLGRVGHGGMGKIYLAYSPGPAGIEKLLVVKRLHSHLTGDELLVNSFLDEARLSMALNHPNIVNTFDVGEIDGRYFMVMEYIEGQNLGVVLRTAKRSGAYPATILWASLFLGVLDGLHAAHIAHDARGRPLDIIHRDVSPQNVLVTYEGLPKLVDFGIAKAAMRVSETDAGTLKGKYAYMSPEQVRGETLDARSDVFAAGIVLWEMLAGRRLYKADTIVRSIERILTEPPISPVRVNTNCDPEIARIAFKALQKDREERFSSALEFKEALEEVVRNSKVRTRQSDVRDLMHRLFADVITKQRAVLEACLDDSTIAPGSIDDDDDGPRAAESQLSASVIHSERGEPTTPSSIRSSPLVTDEGDVRKSSSPGRREDRSAFALTSHDNGRSSRRTSEFPPRSSVQSALPAPWEHENSKTAVPHRPLAPLAIAAGIVVVLFVVAAFAVAKPWVKPPPPPVAAAPAPVAPPPLPPMTAPMTAATVPATPRPAPAAPAPAPAPAPATRFTAEPRVAGRSDDAKKPNAAAKKKADKPAPQPSADEAAPVENNATLSLDTVPWTVVYLGKRRLGETPLVKVPVPAGNLELLLVNAEASVREPYLANVKPGQDYKARLDLN